MKNTMFIAFRLVIFFTVVAGIIYPLFITGISLRFFTEKAQGSLVITDGVVMGSKLIGQQFDSISYFSSRPSAVSYQAYPSGASNLSWTDVRLKEIVASRKEAFLRKNMLQDTIAVPLEMLFASASGIDPHISPGAAHLQVERITVSRKFNEEQKYKLIQIIAKMTEKPQYSVFGEERINVFLLNLELDKIE
jgi:K+-transporting ATPase ATPase C chain